MLLGNAMSTQTHTYPHTPPEWVRRGQQEEGYSVQGHNRELSVGFQNTGLGWRLVQDVVWLVVVCVNCEGWVDIGGI